MPEPGLPKKFSAYGEIPGSNARESGEVDRFARFTSLARYERGAPPGAETAIEELDALRFVLRSAAAVLLVTGILGTLSVCVLIGQLWAERSGASLIDDYQTLLRCGEDGLCMFDLTEQNIQDLGLLALVLSLVFSVLGYVCLVPAQALNLLRRARAAEDAQETTENRVYLYFGVGQLTLGLGDGGMRVSYTGGRSAYLPWSEFDFRAFCAMDEVEALAPARGSAELAGRRLADLMAPETARPEVLSALMARAERWASRNRALDLPLRAEPAPPRREFEPRQKEQKNFFRLEAKFFDRRVGTRLTWPECVAASVLMMAQHDRPADRPARDIPVRAPII